VLALTFALLLLLHYGVRLLLLLSSWQQHLLLAPLPVGSHTRLRLLCLQLLELPTAWGRSTPSCLLLLLLLLLLQPRGAAGLWLLTPPVLPAAAAGQHLLTGCAHAVLLPACQGPHLLLLTGGAAAGSWSSVPSVLLWLLGPAADAHPTQSHPHLTSQAAVAHPASSQHPSLDQTGLTHQG
jgi:hypothetical protein